MPAPLAGQPPGRCALAETPDYMPRRRSICAPHGPEIVAHMELSQRLVERAKAEGRLTLATVCVVSGNGPSVPTSSVRWL
jgi:hypothetical protein